MHRQRNGDKTQTEQNTEMLKRGKMSRSLAKKEEGTRERERKKDAFEIEQRYSRREGERALTGEERGGI